VFISAEESIQNQKSQRAMDDTSTAIGGAQRMKPVPSATQSGWRRRFRASRSVVLLLLLIGGGLWLRTIPAAGGFITRGASWPWQTSTMVTLYFADGPFLFPVSRRMPSDDNLARAALQALIEGPSRASGLTPVIPPGVEIRSFALVEGVAQVDLSEALLTGQADARLAELAMIDTLTALPGVEAVSLSVEGRSIAERAVRRPLFYYPSANGLTAVPARATDPRSAVDELLAGSADPELTGLPRDVRILSYELDVPDGDLSINFTYTPSVRTLALEKPERMRLLLLGLITSLTEFPEVRTVRVDFEGQTRLGLGQCSDLLRSPQPRPALLNDERLVERLEARGGR
jgi:spore germination protein GerM